MFKKSLNKSKRIFTIVSAALIVISAASALTGCGESDGQTDETKIIQETQVVTKIVDGTAEADENGNAVSDGNTDKAVSSNGKNNSGSSKTNSSDSQSEKSESSKNNGSDKPNSAPSKQESSASSSRPSSSNSHGEITNSNACSIDGNKYAVGDTVTCVYKLTSPETLENYQAYIKYDSKYLSVKSAFLESPANSGGILNFKLKGKVNFNGSNISSGYDYTESGKFVTVNYVVKQAGATSTSVNWQVATGVSGKAYVVNDKPVNGLKIEKEFS